MWIAEAFIPRNKQEAGLDIATTMQGSIALCTDRQRNLIARNAEVLEQGVALMRSLDDSAYCLASPANPNQRAGGHMRHVLEFYECFLEGLDTGYIDYDARRRDHAVERFRTAAIARAQAIVERIQNHALLASDETLFVRAEDYSGDYPFLRSSSGRELQMLLSHTVHHFAILSMILVTLGVCTPANFGVAASTRKHRESLAASQGLEAA
jgi:hypothetical protein